jgi:hypothetical protein
MVVLCWQARACTTTFEIKFSGLIFLFCDILERIIFRFGTHMGGVTERDASGDPVGAMLALHV